MEVTLGQQYNVGEKPTVILYTYRIHSMDFYLAHFFVSTAFEKKMRWKDEFRKWLPKLSITVDFSPT